MPISREERVQEQSGAGDKPFDDPNAEAAADAAVDDAEDARLAEQAKERPQD